MATLPLLCLLLSPLLVNGNGPNSLEDITVQFTEPIYLTNQLLYDIDKKIESIIKIQQSNKDAPDSLVYSDLTPKNADNPEILNATQELNTMSNLVQNLGELDKRLQTTFQDLQTRRRYVLGAMIRQMQSTVRRLRSNVVRMQVQMTTLGTAATQPPLPRPTAAQSVNSTNTIDPNIAVNANKEIIEQIEERINLVTKRINDIVSRLSSSLSATASTIGESKPLNPIITLNSVFPNHHQHHLGILNKNNQHKKPN